MITTALVRRAQCTGGLVVALAALATCLTSSAEAQQPAANAPAEGAPPAGAPSTSGLATDAPPVSAPPAEPPPTDAQAASAAPASPPSASAGSPDTVPAPAPLGDEVIADPELQALPQSSTLDTPRAEPNGQVRLVLRSRLGIDTQWQDPREDVLEATQIVLFEAKVRRSERLRFEVGVRARYLFATREHATADAGAGRYELDLAPTAAYADATLADGVHLRLGYQGVRLGRFDVLNASDILSSYDLRSGMTTMPEANELAQPAVRIDWDAASWLSLTAIALPFFQPHVVRAFEGDYAILVSHQADVDKVYGQLSSDPAMAQAVQARIRSTLSRTGQGQLAESAFSAFAPQPSFKSPQAALRATMHGPAGELGLTAGTALEHLPAVSFSQTFLDYLGTLPNYTSWQRTCEAEPLSDDCSRGIMASRKADNALLADPHPIRVNYDRFELFSVDGATALGPLQIGAEIAYMLNRTQLSAPSLAAAKNGEIAVPVHTDMAHAGLRVEWLRSDTWVIAVEASAERAVKLPHDPNRRYLFTTYYGWLLAALGFVTMAPFEEGPTFELGGGVLNGPSYMLTPRLEQRIVDRFYIEAGAYLLFGKRRPLQDPRVTLGGLYKDSNQVFVGLRWLP